MAQNGHVGVARDLAEPLYVAAGTRRAGNPVVIRHGRGPSQLATFVIQRIEQAQFERVIAQEAGHFPGNWRLVVAPEVGAVRKRKPAAVHPRL